MTMPEKLLKCRLSYLNGEGSLRALSQRFGVPLRTLERRCSGEGWRSAVKQSGGAVAAVAAEVTVQQGQRIGLSAAEFVERSFAESIDWLDQIQRAKALMASDDIAGLRDLITAWRIAKHADRVRRDPAQWLPWNYRQALEASDTG